MDTQTEKRPRRGHPSIHQASQPPGKTLIQLHCGYHHGWCFWGCGCGYFTAAMFFMSSQIRNWRVIGFRFKYFNLMHVLHMLEKSQRVRKLLPAHTTKEDRVFRWKFQQRAYLVGGYYVSTKETQRQALKTKATGCNWTYAAKCRRCCCCCCYCYLDCWWRRSRRVCTRKKHAIDKWSAGALGDVRGSWKVPYSFRKLKYHWELEWAREARRRVVKDRMVGVTRVNWGHIKQALTGATFIGC